MHIARRAWTLYEPIHAIVYFAPESLERYREAGLRGGWMGYFASRAAAMGPVGPELVTAVFHNFRPAMVQRAIPDAWSFSSVSRVLEARLSAVDAALRRLWAHEILGHDMREAADLAWDVAGGLRGDGRPLYAAHAGLQKPDEPHLLLWHACTLLREHRFDGHVAALTVHGLDGLDSLVVAVGTGSWLDAPAARQFRGWTEDEWTAAEQRLRDRGVIDNRGALTSAGAELKASVESATDAMAAPDWEQLDEARRDRLFQLMQKFAERLEGPGGLMYPNPVGVTRPA